MPLLQLLVNPDMFKYIISDALQLPHVDLKSVLVMNYCFNCSEEQCQHPMLRQTELRNCLASTAAGSHSVNMSLH